MMNDYFPRPDDFIRGDRATVTTSIERWSTQAVDYEDTALPPPWPVHETTLAGSAQVAGPGTFDRSATRTMILEPSLDPGWWFERVDRPDDLPTAATVRNVWTTGRIVSNIVLRSGDPHNYCRMVEHILALKVGLILDRVLVKVQSGDPPLFEHGSLDLVQAVERAGIQTTEIPAQHLTVSRPVGVCASNGAFIWVAPPSLPYPSIHFDVAIDFPNVIGQQRVRFFMTPELFRRVCVARTNASSLKKLYCQTVGRLFADIRRLGYNRHNLLIAGRRGYHNRPRLIHNGRSLEAVWHRAALDLAAALALVEGGRFVGRVVSYRAGHALDVRLVTLLHRHRLLVPFAPPKPSDSTSAVSGIATSQSLAH